MRFSAPVWNHAKYGKFQSDDSCIESSQQAGVENQNEFIFGFWFQLQFPPFLVIGFLVFGFVRLYFVFGFCFFCICIWFFGFLVSVFSFFFSQVWHLMV